MNRETRWEAIRALNRAIDETQDPRDFALPTKLQLTDDQYDSIKSLDFPRMHRGWKIHLDRETRVLFLYYWNTPKELIGKPGYETGNN